MIDIYKLGILFSLNGYRQKIKEKLLLVNKNSSEKLLKKGNK